MTLAPSMFEQEAPAASAEDAGKVATPSAPDGAMANIDDPASGAQPTPDPAATAASKLQSERDKATSRVADLETENTALKAKIEEIGDLDELEFDLSHERDSSWTTWLEQELDKGATLQQLVSKVRAQTRAAQSERQQHLTQRSSVENLISMVEDYDKGFGKFLRAGASHGMAITQDTLPKLKETYKSFSGDGATPAQAAAAAAEAAPQHAPVPSRAAAVAPVTPQPGTSAISDAPIVKKGRLATSGAYFRQALTGGFGTTMERRSTRE